MARARRNVPNSKYKKQTLPNWFHKLQVKDGWECFSKTREGGQSKGYKDKYYVDPDTGHKFRSQPEVIYYLKTGKIKPVGINKVKKHKNSKSKNAGQIEDLVDKNYPTGANKGKKKDNMKENNREGSPMETNTDDDEDWHDFALAPGIQAQDNTVIQDVMQAQGAAAIITFQKQSAGGLTNEGLMESDVPTINGNLLALYSPEMEAEVQEVLGDANDDIWNSLDLDDIVDMEVIGNFDSVVTRPSMLDQINNYELHEDNLFCGHDCFDVLRCTDLEFYRNPCYNNEFFTQTSNAMEDQPRDCSENMDEIRQYRHGQPEGPGVHDAPLEDVSNLRDVEINKGMWDRCLRRVQSFRTRDNVVAYLVIYSG